MAPVKLLCAFLLKMIVFIIRKTLCCKKKLKKRKKKKNFIAIHKPRSTICCGTEQVNARVRKTTKHLCFRVQIASCAQERAGGRASGRLTERGESGVGRGLCGLPLLLIVLFIVCLC